MCKNLKEPKILKEYKETKKIGIDLLKLCDKRLKHLI